MQVLNKYILAGALTAVTMAAPAMAQDKVVTEAPAQTEPVPVPPAIGPTPGQSSSDIPPPIPVPPVPYTSLMMSQLAMYAEMGAAPSQTELGIDYANGRGVRKDAAAAAGWWRRAAAQGYALAEVMLGGVYERGDGIPQDYGTAKDWFQKAADQGYGIAQMLLGKMYHEGLGVAQDDVQAYMWLDLATKATQGKTAGDAFVRERNDVATKMTAEQIRRAEDLEKGWTPAAPTRDQLATSGMEAYLNGDYAQTLRIVTPLANDGHALAQFILGNMYHLGEGVPRDDATAVLWYYKAALQGQPAAQFFLGTAYHTGEGAAQDDRTATDWLHKSAKQGFGLAQYGLGMISFTSQTGIDTGTAAYMLKDAADQGIAEAQDAVGLLYLNGHVLPKDMVQAYKWIKLATRNADGPQIKAKAAQHLDIVTKAISAEQRAEAEALVTAWKPIFPDP